jgi:hypothetical protein
MGREANDVREGPGRGRDQGGVVRRLTLGNDNEVAGRELVG